MICTTHISHAHIDYLSLHIYNVWLSAQHQIYFDSLNFQFNLQFHIMKYFNWFWPSDDVWQHKFVLTLVQIMAAWWHQAINWTMFTSQLSGSVSFTRVMLQWVTKLLFRIMRFEKINKFLKLLHLSRASEFDFPHICNSSVMNSHISPWQKTYCTLFRSCGVYQRVIL